MDRALRSSSACCSCSGRGGHEALPVHNHWSQRLHASHVAHQHRNGPTYPSGARRRGDCALVHSQQRPRQRGGGAPNNGGDENGLTPSEGRIIASLVTSGLSGTLAVLGAALARVDLFGQFRWLSTDDLLLGLTSASALLALEAALLAPPYDRLLAGAGRPGAKAGAVGLRLPTAHVGQLLSADTLAATLVLQQACLVAAQVVRRRGLTQTSPALEAGLVCVREAAKELLQRGLLFTFAAAWLADRAFEAGADDTILLPLGPLAAAGAATAPSGFLEVYVTDAARFAAGALLTGSLMPVVLNEAEAMRLGVASNLALVMVEQQAEAEAEEQRRRRGRGTQGAGPAEARTPGAAEAEAQGAEAESYDEGLEEKEMEGMLREYRLFDALGRCTSTGPPRLTYGLTLLRGLLRFGAPNLTFALTGNLAASLVASAVPQLMLLAYVLRGPMVLLERPQAQQQSPRTTTDGPGEGDAT